MLLVMTAADVPKPLSISINTSSPCCAVGGNGYPCNDLGGQLKNTPDRGSRGVKFSQPVMRGATPLPPEA